MPFFSLPTVLRDEGKKATKVKRARRTRTEISASAPTTARGEREKAAALAALDAGDRPSKVYSNPPKPKKVKRAQREAAALDRLLTQYDDPAKYARLQERKLDRQLANQVRRGEIEIEEDDRSFAEKLLAGGVVGLVDEDASAAGRKLLYGTENPSVAQLALAAPIPLAKGAQLATRAVRAVKGADAAATAGQKVAKVAPPKITPPKIKRKPRSSQALKPKPKATKRVQGAKHRTAQRARMKKRNVKARVSPRGIEEAAQRIAYRAQTGPVLAKLGTSAGAGGAIGAAVQGHLQADPIKALTTTAEAIPATFAFLGTAAADAAQTAVTGDTGHLKGTLKQAKGAVTALKPLISGDPDEVEQAVEEDLGYVFAPLLPRGAVSVPGRAVRKGVGKTASTTADVVAKAADAVIGKVNKGPQTAKPGPARRVRQLAEGKPDRRRMSEIGGRTMGAADRAAKIAAKSTDEPAAKVGKKHGPEAESLAVVMHAEGIGPKNPLAQLEPVLQDLKKRSADDPGIANELKAIGWAKGHPEVFDDPNLWESIAEMKRRTDQTSTSESAKYVSQGRVAGVVPRHEMVPAQARDFTDAATRGQAWVEVKELADEAKELRVKAREARARAKEAGPSRTQNLLNQAKLYERAAKKRQARSDQLKEILEPYSRPGAGPSNQTKRVDWDAEMNARFIENVKAERHPDNVEPGWMSERANEDLIGDMGGPQVKSAGPRVVEKRSGESAAADIVDRSFPAFLANSIRGPRIQRGVNDFIRETIKEFKVKVPGRNGYVVKSTREANDLVRDKLLDPRDYVFVPIRHIKQSVKAQKFEIKTELGGYHSDLIDSIGREIGDLEGKPGTKYVIMKRDVAREFADQLNPEIGGLEGGLSTAGTVASRALLGTNPAWLQAQFVNELSQSGVAVNPLTSMRARVDLHNFGEANPLARERFRSLAGDSPSSMESISKTHQHTVTNHADAYEAYRYSRKTPAHKALSDLVTLRTLGKVDRWKSGAIRETTLAAGILREINGLTPRARREVRQFFKGLHGMQDLEYAISKELRGLPRAKQLERVATDPKLKKMMDRHLDRLDDTLGNWDSFTRLERRFAPLTIFYPYLRMSLRWTFGSYAKHHPVKAQILYLLAQSNRDELEKLLGREPTFIEGAVPVVHGADGSVSSVLPGGRRFGAPGMNSIVEAVGAENLAGLVRALNPAISLPLTSALNVELLSGKQNPVDGNIGEQLAGGSLLAARQLLSLSGPVRVTVGSDLGKPKKSGASKHFDTLDPVRDERSIFLPFLPQSAENFKEQSNLSEDFRKSDLGIDSEVGQVIELVERIGPEAAKAQLREQAKGKKGIAQSNLPPLPDIAPEVQEVIDLMYALKSKGSSSKSTSSGTAPKIHPGWGGSSTTTSTAPAKSKIHPGW